MSRFEEFSVSVFTITRYWNKIATDVMKEYGLKGAYALYLVVLADAPEDMTAARLSEITHRDKADVSRAISRFKKQGIIESYGESRYRAPLCLTEQGRALASRIQNTAAEALALAGEGLSEQMRKHMYQALDIIANNLKDMVNGGE